MFDGAAHRCVSKQARHISKLTHGDEDHETEHGLESNRIWGGTILSQIICTVVHRYPVFKFRR